jgi:hypothetical protein
MVGRRRLHEAKSRREVWWKILQSVGLRISRSKTEHLFYDFGGPSSFSHKTLDGVPLPTWSDFRYFGSLVQNDGEIDRDVINRMNAGWT